jgi:homoserine O-acetyltransferase
MRLGDDHNHQEVLHGARARRGEFPLRLRLRHGAEVELSITYETNGRPDGPLLIAAGGISAGRHAFSSSDYPEPGWWESQKKSFRLDSFKVLSIDWVGADGLVDEPIDPADQAEAIERLLTDLGIEKAAAFIGASYGGMVGMHLAVREPSRIGALLAISAADYPHPFSSACRSLQRRAMSLGEAGDDQEAGVALARAMAMLTYRTPQEFAVRFAERPQIEEGRVRVAAESYLDFQGMRHSKRMSSTAYRRLSESIDLHKVDANDFQVPLTLAAVDQDTLVPAADVEALADGVPGSRFHLVKSRFGHDAFLKEDGEVAAIITHFLNSLEQDR